MNDLKAELLAHLEFIYNESIAASHVDRIYEKLIHFRKAHPHLDISTPEDRFSEKDCVLITYGDMVQEEGRNPLDTLSEFLSKYIAGIINTVHILPFFPYSSDDGFSVIDYRQVNPALGNWEDISSLGENFRLMFDAVINHCSIESGWFQGFLNTESKYQEYFTVVDEEVDLSQVFRPRASPLLTAFNTLAGKKLVWTTFSSDQVDLNFRNPEVLIEIIDILLFYAAKGAKYIRLDAVTYIWKEIGTSSINMPKTHRIIQLLRTILDVAAPRVSIITETNVPHVDNISYFGDGTNEAQMVYNFALPLLTIHAFYTQDVSMLSKWAQTLDPPSEYTAFFNFLAGHDGIGILPVKDILSSEDLEAIISHTIANGGFVSYKSNADGSQSPYELNINYLDVLSPADGASEDILTTAKRFLASQAIMLALRGVPGIYFHSLFGSRNWNEGVNETARFRTINRQKLRRENLEKELADPLSLRHQIYRGYCQLLTARSSNPAFHPNVNQKILSLHKSAFIVQRTSPGCGESVLCLHNVSPATLELSLPLDTLSVVKIRNPTDILSDHEYPIKSGSLNILLPTYGVLWLRL